MSDTLKTLNDVCDFIVDCLHATAPTQDEGYPLIRTPNIGKGRLILDGVYRVSEDTYKKWTRRAVPQPNDLVLAREAPAGNVAVVKNGQEVCLGQRTVHLRPDLDQVDPDFLCYFLLTPQQQGRLLAGETGATAKHVNMKDIRRLQLKHLPKLKIQHHIGSILSTYDDLIENNRRRIELLEQAARLLYKEWFVQLRFPGHEHVKITDGVPEGWDKKPLFAIVSPTYGFAFKSKLFNTDGEGLPVARIRDIPSGESQTYTTEEAPEEKLLEDGEFVIGMDGDFHMNFWTGGKTWINQRVVRIKGVEDVSDAFLRYACEKPIQDFNATIVGTTVAHLGAKHLKLIEVLIPPKGILNEAQDFFDSIRSQIVSLSNQSRFAKNARDLLLPRLMNGEVAV